MTRGSARGEQPRLLFLRDSLAIASCLLYDDFLFLRKKDLGDGIFAGACVQELLIRKKKRLSLMPREIPCGDSAANAALVLPAPLQAQGRLRMRGLEQPLLFAMVKYRLIRIASLELKQQVGSVQGCSLHLKLHPDLQMKTFC